jgi:hypothetical protein
MLPLSLENEDESLKTIDGTNHSKRDVRNGSSTGSQDVDEVTNVDTGRGENDGTAKINEHNEPHTETAETTKLLELHELDQVVDGRVNPSSTLRQENTPRFGSSRLTLGIGNELVGHLREILGHQGSEVTILTKGQQVLLVKRVHITDGIVLDNTIRDDERLTLINTSETVHSETEKNVSKVENNKYKNKKLTIRVNK